MDPVTINQPELSFGWLFFKTILATVIVIVLAYILLRYFFPRLHGLGRRASSRIRILERFGLEPRKALYIIQIGKKLLLLGTSDHGINKLTNLDREDLEV